MYTTSIRRHIAAPRSAVYRALIDARAVERWMVPDGMTSVVHEFEPHEGGTFRISLSYDEPKGTGKTSAHTDTQRGRFVKLVENELVMQRVSFESDDPTMAEEMTITITLCDAHGGTDLHAVHEGVPDGVRPEDNELGWSMSLAKLAALVERGGRRGSG